MCGLSGQFVDSTVLILKSEVCRTAFSQNRSWLKSFLQGAYLFGAKIGSFGGIFAMKKTIALFAAVLMLLCAVPFAAIGEMNLAAAKTAGDFPDAVFDPLGDAASVEYSHNTNFTGESGTEFVSDGENGIKSASGGMRSSVVTITITFGEAVSNARLSFDYKVSSEARYDYLSVNGSTEKLSAGRSTGQITLRRSLRGVLLRLLMLKTAPATGEATAFGSKTLRCRALARSRLKMLIRWRC